MTNLMPVLWVVSTFILMLIVIVEAHRWYNDDPTRPYLWLAERLKWTIRIIEHVQDFLIGWRNKLLETANALVDSQSS